MDHDDLVAAFSQTVGVEKADRLITEAADDLGIDPGGTYTDGEIDDVCDTIQHSGDGYVRLVANEVRVRLQARRRFDALLDEITDPVVTVAFESAEPIVTAVNPAFEETFGYGPEAVGEPLTELIVPEDRRRDAVDQWLRSDPDGGVEVERLTADGDRRTLLFRPVVVTRGDGRIEGHGIYTDITERKRRERRLRHQNEQLERFASVVSHDLRNPLQVARGRVEAALADTDDERIRKHLEAVQGANDRMERLIDDLLTLAREGQVVERQTPVRLGTVVDDAWAAVDAPEAAIEVDCEHTVAADRSRLQQLLENLLRNAVEHGSTSPRSTSSREDAVEYGPKDEDPVTVRVEGLDDGFYVEDDGPGIPPEERERVFEHGYTSRTDGTGLGLAIVEAIADAHEWDVAVREGVDGGARFVVTGVAVL
ncbi:PAS domain-containing sensor histidine kinase [Halomicrobium urmianum]|uniref:PAS domain-containing sensor histidine kinase n=1 Tax=Halomicrobium urmianum TaxID=1586233 RepID=UPI001CDA54D1|nr:PAS domain-containing sensor histidine kinase [Halomicrobium urmianum]